MSEILNDVAAVLKDPSLQARNEQPERKPRIRQIILDTFDFEEMAKLALGVYGDRLTPQQRTEFVSLLATSSSDHTKQPKYNHKSYAA
jgi:ABC-type transporter MlaC component